MTKKRPHTQRFRSAAEGYQTTSGKRRIPLTLDTALLARINEMAKANDRSVSSTIADIIRSQFESRDTAVLRLTQQETQLLRSHRAIFGHRRERASTDRRESHE